MISDLFNIGVTGTVTGKDDFLIDNKEDYFKVMQRRLNTLKPNRERSFTSLAPGLQAESYAVPMLLEPRKPYNLKHSICFLCIHNF